MAESNVEQVARIARNAIEEIERIVRGQSSVASTPNLSGSSSTQVFTQRSIASSPRTTEPPRSALTELRRRFPTLNSSGPSTTLSRRRNCAVGRPGRNTVVKDLMIVASAVERTPLGRHDRLDLEQEGRVVAGFSIDRRWSESVLYEKVKAQFPDECANLDFEFVKNIGGVLVKPNLATGVKIDANILLRSIASTNCVYVRLLESDHDDDSEDDNMLMRSPFESSANEVSETTVSSLSMANMEVNTEHSGSELIDLTSNQDKGDISNIVNEIIKECETKQNPAEILRVAQSNILIGRPLDITDVTAEITGETNFILVDRNKILETGISEILSIDNFRLPIEVNFIGEAARDCGGPRKEFFRLVLIEIKETMFDGGLRLELEDKYMPCGIIMGLSVLQNGKIPQFMSEEILQEIIGSTQSPCIRKLQRGLEKVGVLQLMCKLPSFLYLFRPSPVANLSFRKLTHLLDHKFAEEGTNARHHQKNVYNAFVRYCREVNAGRRELEEQGTLTLGRILEFVCGTDEEPVLGFAKSPEIHFFEVDESFLPTANTCVNVLNLPHASITKSLPSDEVLFRLYDYAFANAYFGNS
jgi:hypothetical protein